MPAVVLGIAALAVVSVLIAGNMGFKFNKILYGAGAGLPGGGSSLVGLGPLGLPYRSPLGDAKDLLDDLAREDLQCQIPREATLFWRRT